MGIARKRLLGGFDDGIEADVYFCITIADVVELLVEVSPCSNEKKLSMCNFFWCHIQLKSP